MLEICPAGEFKSGHLCCLSTAQFAKENPEAVGVKKWSYAENVWSSLRFFDEALEPHSWRQNRSGKKKIGLKEDPFGRPPDHLPPVGFTVK